LTRILVLSDLHLCNRLSTIEDVAELRPLWLEFNELILNGDTEESYSKKYSMQSQRATRALIQSAENDSVKVHLLNGNHDPVISDQHAYFSHDEKVLIMHGHAIFPDIAPWTWYASKIKAHRDQLLQTSGDSFDAQLESTRIASDRSAKSREAKNRPGLIEMPYKAAWSVAKILQTWWRCPSLTEQWLSKYAPKTKIVVVGHTHRAGIWKINNRIIINTGCFAFPSHPRGVVIEGNTLQVFRIRKTKNKYFLDQELGSWQLDAL
jgi:predicted phosphodiesterase